MTSLSQSSITVRRARTADAVALAELHAARIAEGFLPTLGPRFLARLYRRIARSQRACAYVAESDGRILAFAAGTPDVSAFYREFVLRDGVISAILVAPKVFRAWRPVLETLRYPAATADLPAAEVLAVATAADAGGHGYGSRVVRAVTADLAARGNGEVKVVVGDGNETALRMYRACSFVRAGDVSVHGERRSEILAWTAS